MVALAKREKTWVIEDFHKVDQATRNHLADVLKVFSDHAAPKTAIVVLGATESASAVVEAPADVTRRVVRVHVPPLDDKQLGQILDEGGRLMRVDFSPVRRTIIRNSAGVASVTHALALACLDELGIDTPPKDVVTIQPETLRAASRIYVRGLSHDMKERFEKAVFRSRTRKFDNCTIILKALAALPEHGGMHNEILTEIRKQYSDYPTGNLTYYSAKLTTEERGALVRKTGDNRFRFDEPLQHTYAQLLFKIEPENDDLFAEEVAAYVSEEDREYVTAAGAAGHDGNAARFDEEE